MKSRALAYWITTGLVAFFIGGGGASQIWQYKANLHGVVPALLYPMYFFGILGIWKALGAIAILVPRFPLLKEWAYAGIFFDLTGAAASRAAVGGYGAYGFHVIAPPVIAGLTVGSWVLRPRSRAIGVPSGEEWRHGLTASGAARRSNSRRNAGFSGERPSSATHHPPQDEPCEGGRGEDDQGHANQTALDHAYLSNQRDSDGAQAVS
jgi:hypothetical protein